MRQQCLMLRLYITYIMLLLLRQPLRRHGSDITQQRHYAVHYHVASRDITQRYYAITRYYCSLRHAHGRCSPLLRAALRYAQTCQPLTSRRVRRCYALHATPAILRHYAVRHYGYGVLRAPPRSAIMVRAWRACACHRYITHAVTSVAAIIITTYAERQHHMRDGDDHYFATLTRYETLPPRARY